MPTAGASARTGGAEHVGTYLVRRLLYALPILIGVNLITFVLFFVVNSPDAMARMHLGGKRVSQEAIERWKADHGYDRPLLWNGAQEGAAQLTDTVFYAKSVRLFAFDFGRADDGRDIGRDVRVRMGPSLAVAVPTLLIALGVNIALALGIALLRGTYADRAAMAGAVVLMSVSSLFFIIAGQYLFARVLRLAPVSGYDDGLAAVKFVALPVLVAVLAGMGAGVRWYRTIFLEELARDYVRTARAKGLPERVVLFGHVLRNALIPILTGVVVQLPLLFMGSLLLESFFAIPGLGSYTIDAIRSQDFAIVRAMVFLGAVLYLIGLILTDLSYTLADPRVRLA
jgi:peptide/nickel transport system permease protein